jgi:hypothetical protein
LPYLHDIKGNRKELQLLSWTLHTALHNFPKQHLDSCPNRYSTTSVLYNWHKTPHRITEMVYKCNNIFNHARGLERCSYRLTTEYNIMMLLDDVFWLWNHVSAAQSNQGQCDLIKSRPEAREEPRDYMKPTELYQWWVVVSTNIASTTTTKYTCAFGQYISAFLYLMEQIPWPQKDWWRYVIWDLQKGTRLPRQTRQI